MVMLVAMTAALLFTGAPSASAHDSTYCGHGRDGYVRTVYHRYSFSQFGYHNHRYDHYYFTGIAYEYSHKDVKQCGNTGDILSHPEPTLPTDPDLPPLPICPCADATSP